MKKFKLSLASVSKKLLKEADGTEYLVLEIPSLKGRKRFWLKDGDTIEASDIIMEKALEGYEYPKLPIMKKAKGDKKLEQVYYTFSEIQGHKPFEVVNG